MTDTLELGDGPVRYRVEGLGTAIRQLQRAGADTQDMSQLMHTIGQLVVDHAEAPVLTGRLATTIRAGKGKTKAVVRAGGARAPYAGVTHYGWPAHNIGGNPFLLNSLAAERSEIFDTLNEGIEEILRKNDLL